MQAVDRSHFHKIDQKPPVDAMAWLKETAQLELFEEDTWLACSKGSTVKSLDGQISALYGIL